MTAKNGTILGLLEKNFFLNTTLIRYIVTKLALTPEFACKRYAQLVKHIKGY